MISPEKRKFEQPELKTEFPKGFNVVFYDSLGHQKGTARANYALSHDVTQIIELRGNVIIQNFKDKTRIDTEKMYWNRASKQIWGEKAVRIITADRVVTGIGFKANEDLTVHELLLPTGSWWVKDL
jgi:LPS export ABC transporter protein LptC